MANYGGGYKPSEVGPVGPAGPSGPAGPAGPKGENGNTMKFGGGTCLLVSFVFLILSFLGSMSGNAVTNLNLEKQIQNSEVVTEETAAATQKSIDKGFTEVLAKLDSKPTDDESYSDDRYAPPFEKYLSPQRNPVEYDLAIIGGGVGGAYVLNTVRKSMTPEKFNKLKIGIFEKTNHIGGRLISNWEPASLAQTDYKVEHPMEYGGMRVSPVDHFLVWDALEEVARAKGLMCARNNSTGTNSANDSMEKIPPLRDVLDEDKIPFKNLGRTSACDEFMVLQHTHRLRYFTSYEKASETARSSSLFDNGDITEECLGLTQIPQLYQKENNWPAGYSLAKAIDFSCQKDECMKITEKTLPSKLSACDYCDKFRTANNVYPIGDQFVSCMGYDSVGETEAGAGLATASFMVGRGGGNCLTTIDSALHGKDTPNCKSLYFWRQGAQQFTKDLMNLNNMRASTTTVSAVAPFGPSFNKKLVGLTYGDDESTRNLAVQQARKTQDAKGKGTVYTKQGGNKLTGKVQLDFEDGSRVNAKAVYLTLMPYDLYKLPTLAPWRDPIRQAIDSGFAQKLFMQWNEGLPKLLLNSTKGGTIRLILDGTPGETLARQVFMWDERSILVYDVAASMHDENGTIQDKSKKQAAIAMHDLLRESGKGKGLQAVADKITMQLRVAHGVPKGDPDNVFPTPTYVGTKEWKDGSLGHYHSKCGKVNCETPEAFETLLQRPLGKDAPVFYGNSAMNPRQGGWIQGSLEEVMMAKNALLGVLEA